MTADDLARRLGNSFQRLSFPHQSAVACLAEAHAARGRAVSAIVISMFVGGLVKLIARDADEQIVCYAEVSRIDAAALLDTMGFDTGDDLTDKVTALHKDGYSASDAITAARLLVQEQRQGQPLVGPGRRSRPRSAPGRNDAPASWRGHVVSSGNRR